MEPLIHNSTTTVATLGHMNPAHRIVLFLLRSILVLSTYAQVFKVACFLQDSSTKTIHAFLFSYKRVTCPAYGIELWGCSKPSNTKILQTFQSKMLIMISNAPWYVSNQTLHNDFEIPYVTEMIRINTNKYKNRSTVHSNQLIRTLFNPSVDRRLKR